MQHPNLKKNLVFARGSEGVARKPRKTGGHWNISALGGYGLVIQEKSFHTNQTTRYFTGLAPRFDIRFIGGYQTPNWFLMLHTDFDNKSIEFTSLKYTQTYLNIRLVAGYRFKTK